MPLTFEQLPDAVAMILEDMTIIKRHLLEQKKEPSSNPEEFMTIHEVAALLKLKVSTVYGLTSGMKIPYMKKGKRLFFSKKEVTDWLKSGKKKTLEDIANTAKYHVSKSRI